MGNRIENEDECVAQNEIANTLISSQSICAQAVKGGTMECIQVNEDGHAKAELCYDDGHQVTYRSHGVQCPNGYSMTDCAAYVQADEDNDKEAFECAVSEPFREFKSDRSYGEYIVGNVCHAWGSTEKMRAQVRCCRVV